MSEYAPDESSVECSENSSPRTIQYHTLTLCSGPVPACCEDALTRFCSTIPCRDAAAKCHEWNMLQQSVVYFPVFSHSTNSSHQHSIKRDTLDTSTSQRLLDIPLEILSIRPQILSGILIQWITGIRFQKQKLPLSVQPTTTA